MQNPKPEKSEYYDHLTQGLIDLVRDLRRHGYKTGIDQYLAAQNLFLIWEQQEILAGNVIRASLAALFCSNFDEQQRFSSLFQTWHDNCIPQQSVAPPDATEPVTPLTWHEKISPDGKTMPAILLWAVFLCLGLYRYLDKQPMVAPPSAPIVASKEIEPPPITPQVQKQTLIPAPKTPWEPVIVPREFYPLYRTAVETASGLPLISWLAWLAWRGRLRYLTLSRRRAKKNEIIRLENLRFKIGENALFPSRVLKPVWHLWRKYKPFRSRRLHHGSTIKRTLAQSGYFQPVFRDRLLPPEYVLLIDRRHREDFSARLGQELKQRMQAEGLFVSHYQYDTDLRYCRPVDRHTRYFSLEQLANRHHGQSLIVVGEARSFFQMADNRPIPWGKPGSWMQQSLLTINTPEEWTDAEQTLIEQGFHVTPFTRRGILKLIEAHPGGTAQNQRPPALSLDYRDAALPESLRPYAWQWLDERAPDKTAQSKILTALKAYLGGEGFCLLAAVAGYPALDWRLALALDRQLQLKDDEQREIRLRKLARLPWLRNGILPDIWRKLLIRSLSQPEFNKINACYEALMNSKNAAGLIDLPVAIPDLSKAAKHQQEWIHTAPYGDPLQDYVFASVIRGRKPSLLEFTLPARLRQGVPPENWRGLLGPALLGLLLACGISIAAISAWREWGEPFLEQQAKQNMQAALAGYSIKIEYRDAALQAHAQALQTIYAQWGFHVEFPKQTDGSGNAAQNPAQPNHIIYNPKTASNVIELLKQRLNYLTHAAPVALTARDGITANTILIEIRQAITPGAVYRDLIPAKPLSEPGPGMVLIPGGVFRMGSETGGKDEKPVHQVNIKSFAIGRYEVTFDEYDQFVTAANGVRKPDDQGWGRGKRPVINVSWDDANAYAAWLSKKTGRHYRLPTEAEWEYAARAATSGEYFWGDGDAGNYAWFTGNSNKQTHPVGEKKPNVFGLYDVSGNVIEWVQDCYADDYKQAPKDGSAWEPKDCQGRVLRGGSWIGGQDYLRSADRDWIPPGIRNILIGFRLAQD